MSGAKASAERRFARAASAPDGDLLTEPLEALAERVVESIRAELPALAAVASAELRRAVESDVATARAALADGRAPTPAELDASAAATVWLARAGAPLDAINQARRVAARRIFDAWRERAEERGVDPASQLARLYRLWDWSDALAARAAAVYPRAEPDGAGGDEDRRVWFLRGVLTGTLPPADAEARAAAYGLLPGGRYVTLRARPSAGTEPRQLSRAIELSAGANGAGALVAVVEGEVWGILWRAPDLGPGQGVAALGSATELSAADSSFRLATRALETALAFGVDGVVSIDDLGLRPVILAEDHLGERLVKRYLDPLRELGEFGATLEHTVRLYLAQDMRIDDSAKALIIHPNTLRHRIDRFQQLTGADLRRTEDAIEVWWALQRRSVTA